MINNWDILARQDSQSGGLRYTLVTDGTEYDAHLIAKKLQGFVQEPIPAIAPYVYAFELPQTIDEETIEKIRTAAAEVAEQSRKVNEFTSGGILGDPLFNADKTGNATNDSFGTIEPADSFFRTPAPQAPNIQPPQQNDLSATSGEITINDKDMLIKDMEGTLLDKMPLEDIFAAETKYDMFLDLENQKLVKNSQIQREQKMGNLADGKDSLEETFNVFEQKIKDQTCIIELEDLNTITDGLSKKDLSFVQHANTTPPQGLPQTLQQTDTVVSSAGSPLPEETQNNPKEKEKMDGAHAPINLTVSMPEPQTPQGNESIGAAIPAVPEPKNAKEDTFSFSQLDTPLPDTVDRTPAPTLFTVRQAHGQDDMVEIEQATAADPMPEEVNLTNTVPPVRTGAKPISPAGLIDDLPEITIRGQQVDTLEKTFNLETTLNTEIMRTQYEKSFHNTQDPPVMHHKSYAPPQPSASVAPPVLAKPQPAPAPETQPLQPQAAPVPQSANAPLYSEPKPATTAKPVNERTTAPVRTRKTEVNTGEPNMEENIKEKTTFRIRRKIASTQPVPPAPQAPIPPAPVPTQKQQEAAPAQPVPPVQSTPQFAQPKKTVAPAQPVPPTASIHHSPAAPAQPRAVTPNPVIEKTKTIDHSIELPLSELKKHNWPLEVPMIPTYTLENMVISVHRFAHATAISVIENPGKLYNPLVFHGTTGTGKTHFLNAMAYAFSQKYGQENIFMTNGVRLSRGIQRYVMEGNIEKFEKFMDTVKVLLIDDIHLIAVNEQNRTHISALLNKFLREQKQIVITSKYPPESLEKLEQLIRFKLDSGWISELKQPGGSTYLKIVKKMLLDNGVDLNDSQISAFFGGSHMTLGTITRSIRRLKVLENLMYPNMREEDRSQAKIFEKLLATSGEDASSELLTIEPSDITAITACPQTDWGRIGFFYPHDSSNMMPWMVYALKQRAKELGIPGGFEIAVRSSYSTENIISSAFKIANLCDNKKLKGAVILGPSLKVCEPSVRENFYDILTHMLEIMLIRCGIINFEDVRVPSTYVKVISELLR
ncbi:MAG: DnaA ATPase domain-containing protein [Candidatus Avelusimicrobium sp.]|uniref:DnaA ATPase domain-containing protein n=1 Tax=Candidatus Avelusimicrobium sp. TaxID=3048833 RepID=UPI003F002A69